MSHPEIHTDCSDIFMNLNGNGYLLTERGYVSIEQLDKVGRLNPIYNRYFREMVSRSRCAWTDEGDRISAEYKALQGHPDCFSVLYHKQRGLNPDQIEKIRSHCAVLWNIAARSYANAENWKRWGKNETGN